ncbi:6-phosphogluconolactonase [Bordetella sputigena]|uniref:lactonase family protein n=1 Tax=Bordetella sputigena TaxID=1416810 RepID=UPI0039F0C74C
MEQERLAGHGLETGPVLLASVGRRLVRYRLGGDGFIEQDRLEMPLTVQYACFHPGRPLAYVACSNGGIASPGDRHCLVQVSLGDTGMRIVAEPVALPYRPLHASVDARCNRLALAYNRPAAVTIHDLDHDGGLVPRRRLLAEGTEKVGCFPHQVIPMPGSRDLLLTCRGDDASTANEENPGSLRVLRDDGQTLACTRTVAPNAGFGFGPRNCAFHPQGHMLYAVLERQNRLAAFRYREGLIEPQPSWDVGLLDNPDKVRRPQLGGAIAIHPTGRYAYVVNRAHPVPDGAGNAATCGENSVVVFRLDARTGEPREMQRATLDGLHARCLALSRDGNVLVAALRQPGRFMDDSGRIVECTAGFVTFHIGDTGHLTFIRQDVVEVGNDQLFWADFAPV